MPPRGADVVDSQGGTESQTEMVEIIRKGIKMATNAEIYKTVEERSVAFRHFCRSSSGCDGCSLRNSLGTCEFLWLALEVNYPKLFPCPFCGTADIRIYSESNSYGKLFWARCSECGAMSEKVKTKLDAIKAWNKRV